MTTRQWTVLILIERTLFDQRTQEVTDGRR